MIDLIFDEGRALVKLSNGKFLSIINQDRQALIDQTKVWSPAYIFGDDPFIDVQADDNSWEVAAKTANFEDFEIAEWSQYARDDGDNVVYGFVPKHEVLAYIEANNGENSEEF